MVVEGVHLAVFNMMCLKGMNYAKYNLYVPALSTRLEDHIRENK
jgi:hypothetical protein